MEFQHLTEADHEAFWRDGYLIKRRFVLPEEVELLRQAIETDPEISANVLQLNDAEGGSTALALWNNPPDDVFGALASSERMAGGAEKLMGGEVYHYHSKLTLKRPGGGGRWEWHQDYGYWYQNGCLFPDMVSIAVAIDRATTENGCMKVMTGSHKLGRIDHGRVAGQTGADEERVEEAAKVLPVVDCVMDPGDVLFFHSNTLHCSSANLSDHSRNLLICCYNKASNDPYKDHHHPRYTPLTKLPDDAVLAAAGKTGASRDWLKEGKDETTEAHAAS